MLILSRKADEGVIIGDEIEIKVVSVEKGSVKLGFCAPSKMVILRSELKDAIVLQNQQASSNAQIQIPIKISDIMKK